MDDFRVTLKLQQSFSNVVLCCLISTKGVHAKQSDEASTSSRITKAACMRDTGIFYVLGDRSLLISSHNLQMRCHVMMAKLSYLLVVSLLLLAANARPADLRQSGARMASDALFSLAAPSWWYSAKEVMPTNISIYFVGLGRTGTTSAAAAMNILGSSRRRRSRRG